MALMTGYGGTISINGGPAMKISGWSILPVEKPPTRITPHAWSGYLGWLRAITRLPISGDVRRN